MPTTPKPHRSLAISVPSKSLYRLKDSPCTRALSDLPLPMPLPAYIITSIMTCTKPPTSKAREGEGLKSPSVTVPYMPGAKTMARCAIGVVRLATKSKNAIHLAIADTAYNAAMTEWIAFTPTTYATSSKTARSILLTPTSSAATVLPSTMTLTSKGC